MPPRKSSSSSPRGSTQNVAVKPDDVIAFQVSSTPSDGYLVGVVASTPTFVQDDGVPCALVQPRPLIYVPPQAPLTSPRPSKKAASVKVKGRLVDRTDPASAHLRTHPIPSPSPPPTAVVTSGEVRELQEQRRGLQADLDASRARLREIDDVLQQHALRLRSPAAVAPAPGTASSSSVNRPSSAPSATATKAAEEAVKEADKAERELLLARASLRTVSTIAWADLQRRTRRTTAAALVGLVEAAVTLLHDPHLTNFDDAVQQGNALATRLAAVKLRAITAEDCAKGQAYLKAFPVANTVGKEHRVAPALYKWLAAVMAASQAQSVVAASRVAPSAGAAVTETDLASTKSPDPTPQDPQQLTSGAEAALRKERNDHLEYAQMAEEEIAALDTLIAEAQTLTGSAAQSQQEGSSTIVPALAVPMSWLVCPFAVSEAPDMTACAATPPGTAVAFTLPAAHRLVAVLQQAAAADKAAVATTTEMPPAQQPPSPSIQKADGSSAQEVLPATRISSRRSSGAAAQTSVSWTDTPPAARDAPAPPTRPSPDAAPPAPKSREEELEEKVRLLEARLSSALQQNTKEAELQLLRDEVAAKRGELQRVTDERDRLLLERRERSMLGYGSMARRKPPASSPAAGDEGASSLPGSQPTSARYARQISSPRDVVDRSIVEELEEQLTAAHQRISELQIEASQTRRRPSVGAGVVSSSETALPLPTYATPERARRSVADGAEAGLPAAVEMTREKCVRAAQPPAKTMAQEAYDELEAQLQAVSAELESQRQNTLKLEEQLNTALHGRTEAEGVVAAQKRELAEVWEKLEAAEARAEEQHLLTQQRLLLVQAQTSSAQQVLPSQNAAPSSVSTTGTSYISAQQAASLAPSGLPRPPTQSAASPRGAPGAFAVPSVNDAESKSQINDDVVTVNAGAALGNASRLSMDPPGRSVSADAFPLFGAAALQGQAEHPLRGTPYHRGSSAAALQSRPVEQLSTIELRHEVHRLREEVERHQSGELRLTMELQTIRDKQRAEHKRRRDARVARMQMLTRMQDNIAEVIEKTNQDLEEIPTLLDRGRAEAEALMAKRRMHR